MLHPKLSDKETYHIPGLMTSKDESDDGELCRCPGTYCRDELPAARDCSVELTHAINSYKIIRREKGREAAWRLAGEVCSLLRINITRLAMVKDTLGSGWLVTSVNFREIPGRIVMMFDQLKRQIVDPEYRNRTSCVWGSFEADLESDHLSLERFAAIKPSRLADNSEAMKGARVG